MRLYLAGSEFVGKHPTLGGLGGLENLALLTSYWYIINSDGWSLVEWANARQVPLFLDCGAFSAMTVKAQIDLAAYIAFCQEHAARFEVIASLDAIGDWRTSLSNHTKMQQAGIASIPTFHVQEPFSALIELLQANDYIALGVAGMQKRRAAVMRWLAKCFKLREAYNPTCKFHGFALTSAEIMSVFPWYSVDSSTWMVGRKFGEIIIRKGHRFTRVKRQDFSTYAFKYNIPTNVLPARTMQNEDYFRVDNWNARIMLDWATKVNTQYV